jgi:opacity protein-like surface antigen
MKEFSMAVTVSAVLCISSTAFAQTNPPSSTTGLQAGDNAQVENQQAASSGHSGMSHSKKKHSKSTSSTGGNTLGPVTRCGRRGYRPTGPATLSARNCIRSAYTIQ